jgi:hypothetical protein
MKVDYGVLVIHCSDPRFQDAFHNFIRNDLGLERYALIAVPGGPQLLTALEYLPKFAWAGWRWLKFLDKLGNTERVVLIAHEDCRWYQEMGLALSLPAEQKQDLDLRAAAAALKERFRTTRVDLYFARRQDGRFLFHAL